MAPGAYLSACRTWRYSLTRDVASLTGEGTVTFIGLNPSSADETQDDPTVRRCVRFARDWGYARLQLLNLYAYRSANPKAMFAAVDPIGPENDRVLTLAIGFSDLIVCAWGASADPRRAADVLGLCARPRCLGVTKQGAPRHPLYSRADTKPVAFLPPDGGAADYSRVAK